MLLFDAKVSKSFRLYKFYISKTLFPAEHKLGPYFLPKHIRHISHGETPFLLDRYGM